MSYASLGHQSSCLPALDELIARGYVPRSALSGWWDKPAYPPSFTRRDLAVTTAGYAGGAGIAAAWDARRRGMAGFGAADWTLMLEDSGKGYRRVIPAQKSLVIGAVSNNWGDAQQWAEPDRSYTFWSGHFDPGQTALSAALQVAVAQKKWVVALGDPFGQACADARAQGGGGGLPCLYTYTIADTYAVARDGFEQTMRAEEEETDLPGGYQGIMNQLYVLNEGVGSSSVPGGGPGPTPGGPRSVETRGWTPIIATVAGVGLALAIGSYLVKRSRR